MENKNVSTTNLSNLMQPKQNQIIGFDTTVGYDLLLKVAKNFSQSAFVPDSYKGDTGLGSCVVAIDMAIRLKAAPLMVMQNLYLVNGKPAWSSQWIIAQVNNCGRFSPLEYDIVDEGQETVTYKEMHWENKQRLYREQKVTLQNICCTAYATELRTGKRINGVKVSMKMAVLEGWYGKDGSKWKTMPDLMLRYRAASFFGKLYAPELLMGLQTAEELEDIIEWDNEGNVQVIKQEKLSRKKIILEDEKVIEDRITTHKKIPSNKLSIDGTVDMLTGEIIADQQFLSAEEEEEIKNLINDIKNLRKLKDETIKKSFPTPKLENLDNLINSGFEGLNLEKIREQKEYLAKL